MHSFSQALIHSFMHSAASVLGSNFIELIVESMIQVSRTVSHWSSYCTTCGETAPPFEKNHTKVASDCLVACKNRTSGWNRKSAWGRCRDGQLGRWKEGSWNYCQNGKAHWCCHWYWHRISAETAGQKAESLRLSLHYGRNLCFANLPFFFMFQIALLLQFHGCVGFNVVCPLSWSKP